METNQIQPSESTIEERQKAEYERWFERGQNAPSKAFYSVIANMRPGSNAYEAFADGFASKKSKGKKMA